MLILYKKWPQRLEQKQSENDLTIAQDQEIPDDLIHIHQRNIGEKIMIKNHSKVG